ncbi:MAG: hypothetical protein AAF989_09885 [Planctomycetota bacterium]
MGFLKRILRNSTTDELAGQTSGSFEALSDEDLQVHMGIRTYDAFELTDAIRPSYDVRIKPRQGFRYDEYVDDSNQAKTPVIMAAANRNVLLDLFIELIEPLGNVVDVALESSHHAHSANEDLYREHIDMPVLKSMLWEFEDLLLNDGCTGIAVINPTKKQEVQLDEHKLLIAYGEPLDEFRDTLIGSDVYPDPDMKFITEAEHVHSSSERFLDEFQILKNRFGMDGEEGGEAGAW